MKYFQDMTKVERGLMHRLTFAAGKLAYYEGLKDESDAGRAGFDHWCREVASIWREIDAL